MRLELLEDPAGALTGADDDEISFASQQRPQVPVITYEREPHSTHQQEVADPENFNGAPDSQIAGAMLSQDDFDQANQCCAGVEADDQTEEIVSERPCARRRVKPYGEQNDAPRAQAKCRDEQVANRDTKL